jgi:ArsR family transcriptional regulator
MEGKKAEKLVDIFQALGCGVRFRALKHLLDEKKKNPESRGICACHLGRLCKVAHPTMTHHFDWLVSVGLITSRKEGRWIYYDINMDMLAEFREMVSALK